MKLEHAADVLRPLTKTGDNARIFTEVYTHCGKKKEDDLQTYLDFILENCAEWMELLPEKYQSETALSKPKTAICKLLTVPEIIKELGEDFCKELDKTIVDTWKKNKDSLVQQRSVAATVPTQTLDNHSVQESLNESDTIPDEHELESIDTIQVLQEFTTASNPRRRGRPAVQRGRVLLRSGPVSGAQETETEIETEIDTLKNRLKTAEQIIKTTEYKLANLKETFLIYIKCKDEASYPFLARFINDI